MTKHEEALRRSVHDLVCMTPVACEHGILPGCMARVEEALPIAMGFYALGWKAGAEAQREASAKYACENDDPLMMNAPLVTLDDAKEGVK